MRALPLLIGLLVLLQLPQTFASIPGWDALAFLSNARMMAGEGAYYEWIRPPGMPALLAAVQSVCGRSLLVLRLSALALLVLPMAAAAVLARREGGREGAILSVLLVGLCPLVLLYGGQVQADIATAGLVTAALAAWDRDERLGVILGAVAVLFRYPAGVVLLALCRRRTVPVIALVVGLALLPWLAANYSRFGDPLHAVTAKIVQQQRMPRMPVMFYVGQLAPALGPAVLAAVLTRRRDVVPVVVVLVIALLTLNANKEARYLMVVAPAALVLASGGLSRLGRPAIAIALLLQAWYGHAALGMVGTGFPARAAAALVVADLRPGVVLSDVWVPLSYYGRLPARWLPDEVYVDPIIDKYGVTHVAVSDQAWEPPYATEAYLAEKGYAPVAAVLRDGERIVVYGTGQTGGDVALVENWFNVNE
ncbi:MAG: glycosyltransferase family 39 protein [Candidatus Undinarchaeales archaeon]|nr:glycosyltransferase family 39 protein [Candidatus Undinarchaeales archaeon]MDP7492250.1 glycosyltransferase family 39 protein [Candidatus Undinarchaeales archaeon]